jgi:choline dehydrogenase
VLANRLTAGGKKSVLLLEAGPRDTDRWIHIPLGYGKLFARTDVNWAYESEPEPNLGGRRIFTPRGKVLGGSSSINGLVYIRGQPEDFDGWGIPGWSFKDLLPYFRKSQNQGRGECVWHGVGGPIEVADLPDRHELCDAFIDAAASLGIPRNDDFNGAAQEGAGYYQATAARGRRCSLRRNACRRRRVPAGRKNPEGRCSGRGAGLGRIVQLAAAARAVGGGECRSAAREGD